MKTRVILLIISLAILQLSVCAPAAEKVDNSKLSAGFSEYDGDIYSGYLKVNATKFHHYTFFPSQNEPTTDPLVLWLNGGPGCSSTLGFLYEHGPYVFNDNSTVLEKNLYSWNLNASVIYMESPAIVGFSYADANYTYTDESTASDNLVALLDWFTKFPEYLGREFYITGESYAGVYVPTLTYKIHLHNADASATPKINLKGFGVGNAVTSRKYDTASADVDFYWKHNLFPPTLRREFDNTCGGIVNPNNTVCNATLNKIYNITSGAGILNIYDIYKPCYYTINETDGTINKEHSYNYLKYKQLYNRSIVPDSGNAPGAAVCLDSKGAYEWMNVKGNKDAFYIRNPINDTEMKKKWLMCVDLDYRPDPRASYWVYRLLVNQGYKMVVYSGNTDASVPTLGTQRWLAQLSIDENLAVLQDLTRFYVDGVVSSIRQVAGYYSVMEGGITFIQVNGVGHMVPQWNRPAGKKILDNLVQNAPL